MRRKSDDHAKDKSTATSEGGGPGLFVGGEERMGHRRSKTTHDSGGALSRRLERGELTFPLAYGDM